MYMYAYVHVRTCTLVQVLLEEASKRSGTIAFAPGKNMYNETQLLH